MAMAHMAMVHHRQELLGSLQRQTPHAPLFSKHFAHTKGAATSPFLGPLRPCSGDFSGSPSPPARPDSPQRVFLNPSPYTLHHTPGAHSSPRPDSPQRVFLNPKPKLYTLNPKPKPYTLQPAPMHPHARTHRNFSFRRFDCVVKLSSFVRILSSSCFCFLLRTPIRSSRTACPRAARVSITAAQCLRNKRHAPKHSPAPVRAE